MNMILYESCEANIDWAEENDKLSNDIEKKVKQDWLSEIDIHRHN